MNISPPPPNYRASYGPGTSKVKPNYSIRNLLSETTCDVNLSQITLFIHSETTMLINNCRIFKIEHRSVIDKTRAAYALIRMWYIRSLVTIKCHLFYIGSTIRNLHDRIREHLTKPTSSAFNHLAACNNSTDNPINVLIVRDADPMNLRLKEAFHISKLKPQINSREECNELKDLLF